MKQRKDEKYDDVSLNVVLFLVKWELGFNFVLRWQQYDLKGVPIDIFFRKK